MQLNTLLRGTRRKRQDVGEIRQRHTPFRPPGPDQSGYPNLLSIPTGLAFQTRDGQAYALRRVTPANVELLTEFVRSLSEETRWLRFMTARPCSPEFVRAEVARMVAGAAGESITLIVTEAHGGSEAVAAAAELVCDHQRGAGEVGVVVMDHAQRKGIGSLLLRQLLQTAHELGLAYLHGDMFAENYPMRCLIQALQLPYTATIQAGEMHIIVHVP